MGTPLGFVHFGALDRQSLQYLEAVCEAILRCQLRDDKPTCSTRRGESEGRSSPDEKCPRDHALQRKKPVPASLVVVRRSSCPCVLLAFSG